MRNNIVAAAAICVAYAAATLSDASPAHGQTAPAAANIFVRNAFEHPNTNPPTGSTAFTPADSSNLFTAQMLANLHQESQKQAMRTYAGQINQMVEKAYEEYGCEKNDVGAALGAYLETCWEIGNGSFKIGTASAEEKEKTKATMRQMQNALLASPGYKTTSNKNKQMLYEACTFMSGHLAVQWQGASAAAKKNAVQEEARRQLQASFGIAAGSLTRRPDGAFVSASGGPAGASAKAGGATGVRPGVTASQGGTGAKATVSAPPAKGPLPAASDHGARIFVKYVFQATETRFDQLILFPSGAAFTDLPRNPVAQFDEAALRAALKPYDVGTWKEAGNTLVLTFPNKQREQVTTLRKVPRGWYDGTGTPKADNAYDTYFPVVPLTSAQIAGAWHSQSLTTMGFAGGAAPMVAHGSSSDRVFNPNGTFAEGRSAFTSATTANVGDGFKSGGDVGVYSGSDKKGAGRWRLDGPLLTLEAAGRRTVTLAFALPHWNQNGPPELLIDGDWWRRPEKHR